MARPTLTGVPVEAASAINVAITQSVTIPADAEYMLVAAVNAQPVEDLASAVRWKGSVGSDMTTVLQPTATDLTLGLWLIDVTADQGATDDVYIEWAGGGGIAAVIWWLKGVGATPLRAGAVSATGAGTAPAFTTLPSSTDDLAIGLVASADGVTNDPPSDATGQAAVAAHHMDVFGNDANEGMVGVSAADAGAASVDMSWTLATSATWIVLGASFQGTGSGGSPQTVGTGSAAATASAQGSTLSSSATLPAIAAAGSADAPPVTLDAAITLVLPGASLSATAQAAATFQGLSLAVPVAPATAAAQAAQLVAGGVTLPLDSPAALAIANAPGTGGGTLVALPVAVVDAAAPAPAVSASVLLIVPAAVAQLVAQPAQLLAGASVLALPVAALDARVGPLRVFDVGLLILTAGMEPRLELGAGVAARLGLAAGTEPRLKLVSGLEPSNA